MDDQLVEKVGTAIANAYRYCDFPIEKEDADLMAKAAIQATGVIEMQEAARRLVEVIYDGTDYENGEPSLYNGSIIMLHEAAEAFTSKQKEQNDAT